MTTLEGGFGIIQWQVKKMYEYTLFLKFSAG
jgi:hypothetical protein